MSSQADIEAEVRRILTEPYARQVSSAQVTAITLEGVFDLGSTLVAACPEYFVTRKSLQEYHTSVGNIFAIPSDCNTLLRIWDMDDNSLSVSATATSGGLVKVTTSAVHGLTTGDIVTIHDVAGCTEANGTWYVTVVDTTSFTLLGSTYAAAWTSGGKVFKETDEFELIRRMPSQDMRTDDETYYYLRGGYIVVDDNDFSSDLVAMYYSVPDALTDVPTRFHFGLPSYVAMRLIRVPEQGDKNFEMLRTAFSVAQSTWRRCEDLARAFSPVAENINISESKKVRRWI